MSAFDFISKPISEIQEFLSAHSIELKQTKYEDVYLVKFTSQTNVNEPTINRLKGLIFNHKTGQVLSLTYPVPVEIKDLEEAKQEQLISQLANSEYDVHEALDGTLFRYSYLPQEDKWILSTNNKEDANDAFWMNGISLAKQFESIQASQINLDNLNKNYVYLFIMCHPLNIIVVNHQESKLYHVATYDRTSLTEVDCDLGLPKPPTIMSSIEDIKQKIKDSTQKPVESAGYVVSIHNSGITYRYRFENLNYTRAKQLRGNSNNIDFTLLNLFQEHGESVITEFVQYYPVYKPEYLQLMTRINKLVSKFYREYGLRYKDHRDIYVHPRHHKFLKEIHQILYKDTLKTINKTVQFDDIYKFVLSQPTAKVLYLLNYIHDLGEK